MQAARVAVTVAHQLRPRLPATGILRLTLPPVRGLHDVNRSAESATGGQRAARGTRLADGRLAGLLNVTTHRPPTHRLSRSLGLSVNSSRFGPAPPGRVGRIGPTTLDVPTQLARLVRHEGPAHPCGGSNSISQTLV